MGSFGALVALPSPLRCSGLHSCSWEGRFSRVHVVTLDKSLNYSGLSFLIVPPASHPWQWEFLGQGSSPNQI